MTFGNVGQPLRPRGRERPKRSLEPAKHSTIVVAERNRFEAPLKPLEGRNRVRAPVDEISNTEEAIASRVEVELGQRALKRAKATVHVADDEVAPAGVLSNMRHSGRDKRMRPRARRESRVGIGGSDRTDRSDVASPLLHDGNSGNKDTRTPVDARHMGANGMREADLSQGEVVPSLGRPG